MATTTFAPTGNGFNPCRLLRPFRKALDLSCIDRTAKAIAYSQALRLLLMRVSPFSRRRPRLPLAVAAIVALLLPLTVVFAIEGDGDMPKGGDTGAGDDQDGGRRSWLDVILGEPSQDNLYLGMWSHHFLKGNEEYQTQNNLFGISYDGYYVGTFINSFDDRAWSGGVQRDVYTSRWRRLNLDAGYRAGLLYGYDTLTFPDTKLGPLFQVYADVSYRQFGLQFSWAWEVVTAGFFLRLP